ncbi:MAG TPA: redoxin family protein [Candidatus Acidoferrales bacterium]
MRRAHPRLILIVAALALSLAILFPAYSWCLSSSDTALDLSGKAVDPLKSAAGKVVVLIFVRTDCPISNRYAPTIQRIISAYEGKVAFWLVYPDRAETTDMIRKHDAEYGYKISALRDTEHALVRKSQAKITPEVAVFDASKRLVYHGRIDNWYVDFGRTRSAATTHELDDAIQAALGGRLPPVRVTDTIGCYISDLE